MRNVLDACPFCGAPDPLWVGWSKRAVRCAASAGGTPKSLDVRECGACRSAWRYARRTGRAVRTRQFTRRG